MRTEAQPKMKVKIQGRILKFSADKDPAVDEPDEVVELKEINTEVQHACN